MIKGDPNPDTQIDVSNLGSGSGGAQSKTNFNIIDKFWFEGNSQPTN